jgi:hypothetical protein
MNTERTVAFLMANLGSEIARIFSAQKRGAATMVTGGADRATKIINELLDRPDLGNGRQEVEILKMIVDDLTSVTPVHLGDEVSLSSYFLPFAKKVLVSH